MKKFMLSSHLWAGAKHWVHRDTKKGITDTVVYLSVEVGGGRGKKNCLSGTMPITSVAN